MDERAREGPPCEDCGPRNAIGLDDLVHDGEVGGRPDRTQHPAGSREKHCDVAKHDAPLRVLKESEKRETRERCFEH